jgi:drug/metabolite transporter (DMT)-like permease
MESSTTFDVPAAPTLTTDGHPRPGSLRGVAGASITMFFVGTLAAVSATISDYPVFGGQAVRYAVAAVLLLVIARVRDRRTARHDLATGGTNRTLTAGRRRMGWRDVGLLIALAATGLAGFNVCLVEATRYASPATVGMVIATVPIVFALAGPLQQHRRPSPRVVIAALIVVTGATLANGLGSGSLKGLLLSLGALAGEAGFSLLAVPLLAKLGPIRISAYAAAFAAPMLLIVGLIADGRGVLRMPTAGEAVAFSYISLFITVGVFILWYDSLDRLGADRAGLFAGIIPISAVITTVALGLGTPGPADLAGATLVASGVVVGLRPARR